MKITTFEVDNFKAVRHVAIAGLGEMVVIGGAPGTSKSAVLDAIRLLKSSYGGDQNAEFDWRFNEFEINGSRRSDLARLYRNTANRQFCNP